MMLPISAGSSNRTRISRPLVPPGWKQASLLQLALVAVSASLYCIRHHPHRPLGSHQVRPGT
jgi:hypothetical protein